MRGCSGADQPQDFLHRVAGASDEVVAVLDDFLKSNIGVADCGKSFGPGQGCGSQAAKSAQEFHVGIGKPTRLGGIQGFDNTNDSLSLFEWDTQD